MEINGLPLHVLIVHAAVVFGPLAAVSALAYVGIPSWRDRLRWVTLALVLIATGAIWTAYLSGENFLESDRFAGIAGTPVEDKIETHEGRAGILRWVVSGFAAVTILAIWQHHRIGPVRILLSALVAIGAVATLIYTILTGDAGARAVWEQ